MRVAELWRYPVKSMGGERLDTAQLTSRGIHGDRLWAIRDEDRGELTTGRRTAALLGCTARYAAQLAPDAGPGSAPPVVITFPDGTEVSSDEPAVHERLSTLCGKPVRLVPLPAAGDTRLHRARLQTTRTIRDDLGIPAGERLPSATVVPLRKLLTLARYTTPPGTFFDVYPLHVLTRSSLEAMAAVAPGSAFVARRFRPNVVLEGAEPGTPELGWSGATLTGPDGMTIAVDVPTIRCVVPTREQPGLAKDPQVMRTVAAERDRFLGAYADVRHDGTLTVGDAVELHLPAPPSRATRVARKAARRTVDAAQRLVPGA